MNLTEKAQGSLYSPSVHKVCLSDLTQYWLTDWSRYHKKNNDYLVYFSHEPMNVFSEYWHIKNEKIALLFMGSFQEDRKINKNSPEAINRYALRFLDSLCGLHEIKKRKIYSYWRCSWNPDNHPHFHITILLKDLYRSGSQLLQMAKSAEKIWRSQNYAMSRCEPYNPAKATRQNAHSYWLRTNEGIFNHLGMTPRLDRLIQKRTQGRPCLNQVKNGHEKGKNDHLKSQNDPILIENAAKKIISKINPLLRPGWFRSLWVSKEPATLHNARFYAHKTSSEGRVGQTG